MAREAARRMTLPSGQVVQFRWGVWLRDELLFDSNGRPGSRTAAIHRDDLRAVAAALVEIADERDAEARVVEDE